MRRTNEQMHQLPLPSVPFDLQITCYWSFCRTTFASALAMGSSLASISNNLCFSPCHRIILDLNLLFLSFSLFGYLLPMQFFSSQHCSFILCFKTTHVLLLLLPLKPSIRIRPN
ncbi:peptidyl-prolyl cis-trans isomerase E [Trifolium repens]|nr:peptidyl-prolyl cis-trans isomerase E [Trifolium repens]